MFEAAILGEYPKKFETLPQAMSYVTGSSVSQDLTRPWIRDANHPTILGSFIMVAGKMMADSPRRTNLARSWCHPDLYAPVTSTGGIHLKRTEVA